MVLVIKAASFEHFTPSISGVNCSASLPQSRGDSFFGPLCVQSQSQFANFIHVTPKLMKILPRSGQELMNNLHKYLNSKLRRCDFSVDEVTTQLHAANLAIK